MNNYLDDFKCKLQSFNPASYEDVVAELYELVEPVEALDGANEAIPEVFNFMERYPDLDIGTPGPLVHFIENFYPDYTEQLIASIERQPTLQTVWMVSRILNANLTNELREHLIMVLKLAQTHPLANDAIKDEAAGFLTHWLK